MPWVRLDDRFPSHRKVALLSDRAFRVYVSALCWSSENLTEGKVLDRELRVIAHVRGMKAAAKELEDAKLWDRVDDGWLIHDFLEYNPDRAKVQADRDANAARQQAYRDRKQANREAKRAAQNTPPEAERNGVTPPVTNSVSNGTPAPAPSPGPPKGGPGAAAGERPQGLPDQLLELKRGIAAAGLSGIGWDLRESAWEHTHQAVDRVGVPAMVAFAVNSARLKGMPATASAWVQGWRSLEAPPAQDGVTYLPAVVGGSNFPGPPPRQATSDQRMQQALEAGRRLQALADAQKDH